MRIFVSKVFTMIEILLVVSIIMVATAMLLPNVLRSKEHARITSCMNNLRQIAIGYQNYMFDHNGEMPFVVRWLDDFTPVYPYVRTFRVFKCPSTKTRYATSLAELSGAYSSTKNGKKNSKGEDEYDDVTNSASVSDYYVSTKITDIEKNGNYNNGKGNNPYHFDPSNPSPETRTVLTMKKDARVVYERSWKNHLFKCFNAVYIDDFHYELQNKGIATFWTLDYRGWLETSLDPYP